MSDEIISPDKETRIKVSCLALLLFGLAVAAVVYVGLLAQKLDSSDVNFKLICEQILLLVYVALCVMFVVTEGLGFYLISLGKDILETGQFPPPEAKVVRKTRIRRGPQAKLRGQLAIITGILLAISAIGFPVFGLMVGSTLDCPAV